MGERPSSIARVGLATAVTACSSVVLWVEYVEMKDCITLDRENLGRSILVACTIVWLSYYFSSIFATEKLFFHGALCSILASTAYSLGKGKKQPRQLVISAMVAIWAVRLMFMIANRFRKHGADRRFKFVKYDASLFFLWFCVQMMWVCAAAMPVYLVNIRRKHVAPLTAHDAFAFLLWLTGFVMEWVADAQKAVFRADPKNKQDFIASGLWAHCRHPNYFGEFLVQCGIAFFAYPTLQGWEEPWAVVASPLCALIMLRIVNIHILEQDAEHRWFLVAKYRKYQGRSRAFLWLPWAPPVRKDDEEEKVKVAGNETKRKEAEAPSEKERVSSVLAKLKAMQRDDAPALQAAEAEERRREAEQEEERRKREGTEKLERAVANTVRGWMRGKEERIEEEEDLGWGDDDSWGSDTDSEEEEEAQSKEPARKGKGGKAAKRAPAKKGGGKGGGGGQGGSEQDARRMKELVAWQERLARVAQRVEEAVQGHIQERERGGAAGGKMGKVEEGEEEEEAGAKGLADTEGVRRRGGVEAGEGEAAGEAAGEVARGEKEAKDD